MRRPFPGIALGIAVQLIFTHAMAGDPPQPNFRPGEIFISERGSEGCLAQANWISRIDPTTGDYSIFAGPEDGLCNNNGLRFRPDRRRLTVVAADGTIREFDAFGNMNQILGFPDGIFTSTGPAWDRFGNLYFTCPASSSATWVIPIDGAPPYQWMNTPIWSALLSYSPDEFLALNRRLFRLSISSQQYEVFDDYGGSPNRYNSVRCVAVTRRGDIFAAVDMSWTGNYGTIFRYDRDDPATRRELASGFSFTLMSIALSPDESTLYLSVRDGIYAIDVKTGATTLIHQFFYDPERGNIYGGRGIAVYTPPKPGDMNCDNWVNNFDIDPFVLALSDEASYQATFGWCDRTRADMNADGAINTFDIDGFVEAVVDGTTF